MFIQKMPGESAGPDKPDDTFPEEARAWKVGENTVWIDADQTFRCRDASGWSKPLRPGTDLQTSLYEIAGGPSGTLFAFEWASHGALVVTRGRAELV